MAGNVVVITIKGVTQGAVKAMGALRRSIQVSAKEMLNMAKVGTLAIGGFTAFMVRNSFKTIDALAKTSDKLGIATEQLAGLQHAADLTGVSTNTMNMALQRMARRVSEANLGTGEAVGALKELNLNAEELNALSPDEQFRRITKAMEGVENQSDKVRLAMKLFDTEGVELVRTMALGEDGLADMQREAEKFGLTISRTDAEAIERANDSFTKSKALLKGVANQIAIQAAPMVERFNEFLQENGEQIAAFFQAAFKVFTAIIDAFDWLIRKGGELGDALFELTNGAIRNENELQTNIRITNELYQERTEILKGQQAQRDFILNFIKDEEIKAKALLKINEDIRVSKSMQGSFDRDRNKLMGKQIEANKLLAALQPGIVEASSQLTNEAAMQAFHSVEKAKAEEKTGTGLRMEVGFLKTMNEQLSAFNIERIKSLRESVAFLEQTFATERQLAIGHYQGVLQDLQAAKEEEIVTIEQFNRLKEEAELRHQAVLGDTHAQAVLARRDFEEQLWIDQQNFMTSMFDVATSAIDGISNAVGNAIATGQNLMQSLAGVAKQVLGQLIALFVKSQIQRLILSKSNIAAVAAEASSEGSKAVGLAGANAVASMAGAPFPINLSAPVFGATMQAAALGQLTAGFAAGRAAGSAITGIAHGGLTNVPEESTFLLQRGERVLSPRQNQDLTDFIGNDGGGGNVTAVTIENIQIDVLPNATSADAILNLPRDVIEEIVAGPIIDALNSLDGKGVKPVFAERSGLK